ncbi:MAG: VWA domain-containing protein [Spirochaetia bacterium]
MRLLQPWALLLLLSLPLLVISLTLGRTRRPGIRRVLALILRTAGIVSLAFAAAGAQLIDSGAGMDVVFAVDVSDSVGPQGQREAAEFVEAALAGAGTGDQAAVVLVGRESAVERGLQSGLRSLTGESVLDTSSTSLADGILRSLSLFSDQRERKIYLLSDGQETTGNGVDAARIAREAGVSVSTVPLTARPADGEIFIRRIDVPTEVRVDEVHELRATIAATAVSDATVTVLRDNIYYGEDRVQLVPGDNVITFQGVFSEEGVHRYTVIVEGRRDPIAVNNEADALVRVAGQPTVLYVADDPADSILQALDRQGINVRSVPTEMMPADINELIPYDSVIFDNVPAYDLSLARMEMIERYVRDTGGGFIMIGGDASFGAGGYYGTPIERALPVDMDVTSSMKVPSLAMIFVIDKSGSMGSVEVSGLSKLDLVKEAVIASIEIMNEFYTVGLLAFDADYEWTVPLTQAGNREQITADLSRLSSGGGTVLEGALNEARRALEEQKAAVKHLIVLSDGLTSDAEFEEIVLGMTEESITVSTVSIGSSSDRELMRNIAKWGGGRSYHTTDSSSVPRIFTSETTIVSRNLIVEEDFIPTVNAITPILQGIRLDQIPPLRGFVLTYQKSGAQQILAGTGANPVLSTWQYGLGRSAAFTSDLRAKWGAPWLDWPQYQQFLAQLVRWTQRPAGDSRFQVTFDQGTDSTSIVVDAVEPGGEFRNLLVLSALVQYPNGESGLVDLEQVEPGRYRAAILSGTEGSYLVTVYGDAGVAPQTYGFSVPFAREYIQFETDFALLEQIATVGSGKIVGPGQGADVFVPSLSGRTYLDTLWMWLIAAAILALLVELLAKKLILPVGTVTAATARERGPRTRGIQTAGDAATLASSEPASYEELRKQVADAYRRESKTKREFARWYEGGEHNPVAERKIHIARKRRG